MGGVPSVPRDKSQKLRVIGAGYSRTGTVTMQLALEKLLDGPVMHGGTHVFSREDAFVKKWLAAYAAKRRGDIQETHKLIRDLTAGYVGCTDIPPNDFLQEMIDVYPDAKVVLVTRDPEAWLRSIAAVAQATGLWWVKWLMWPVPGWRWFPSLLKEWERQALDLYDLKEGDELPGLSTDTLLRYNEKVKRIVPKERLLVMSLKDGWEPLCKFLDLPIPDEPLPRANDSQAAEKFAKSVFFRLIQIWMGIFGLCGLLMYMLWTSRGLMRWPW